MDDQSDERPTDLEGWPVPSRDVLRELEQPEDGWPDPGRSAEAQWPGSSWR
jgi:hypothetical protein